MRAGVVDEVRVIGVVVPRATRRDVDVDVVVIAVQGGVVVAFSTCFRPFEVVQSSEKVYLEQNFARNLMVRSVWLCVVRNFARVTKKPFENIADFF